MSTTHSAHKGDLGVVGHDDLGKTGDTRHHRLYDLVIAGTVYPGQTQANGPDVVCGDAGLL